MLCFGCQTERIAPCGSAKAAIRPASKTSKGGAMTFAPSSAARAATASTSSTVTYTFQCGGISSPWRTPRPATLLPRTFAIE
jgi:hypothetical protein